MRRTMPGRVAMHVRRGAPVWLGAALLAFTACSSSSAAVSRSAATPQRAVAVAQRVVSGLPAATITTAAGQTATIYCEVADTQELQENGLMNRTSMPDDQGMAFLFSRPVTVAFWMKDTLIDLSIAFIGADGAIVDIQEMQAQTLDNHIPAAAYQYTIEANATWFARHGVLVGDTVDLSQVIASSTVYGNGQPSPTPTP